MVQSHSRRKDLDVPQWLKDEWKSGNKNSVARVLQESNFDRVTCLHINEPNMPSACIPEYCLHSSEESPF